MRGTKTGVTSGRRAPILLRLDAEPWVCVGERSGDRRAIIHGAVINDNALPAAFGLRGDAIERRSQKSSRVVDRDHDGDKRGRNSH
jgi:hypothetical protein